jgi:hypothetical protein
LIHNKNKKLVCSHKYFYFHRNDVDGEKKTLVRTMRTAQKQQEQHHHPRFSRILGAPTQHRQRSGTGKINGPVKTTTIRPKVT